MFTAVGDENVKQSKCPPLTKRAACTLNKEFQWKVSFVTGCKLKPAPFTSCFHEVELKLKNQQTAAKP